jgi:hypothetical protein
MARLITPEEREQIVKEVKQELLANPEELWNLAESGEFKKIVRARTYERIAKKQAELCALAIKDTVLPQLERLEKEARAAYERHDIKNKARNFFDGLQAVCDEAVAQLEKNFPKEK